jgi:hypothetical protein
VCEVIRRLYQLMQTHWDGSPPVGAEWWGEECPELVCAGWLAWY